MAIGNRLCCKHNRLPLKSLLFYSGDTALAEIGAEKVAVDIDFTTDMGERDDALSR